MYSNLEAEVVLVKEFARNLGLAGAAMFVITLSMLGSLRLSIYVLVAVVLTLTEVLGFVYFWSLNIDVTVCGDIVMNVGLAVDYSVHVAKAFKDAKGTIYYHEKVELVNEYKFYTNSLFNRRHQHREGD